MAELPFAPGMSDSSLLGKVLPSVLQETSGIPSNLANIMGSYGWMPNPYNTPMGQAQDAMRFMQTIKSVMDNQVRSFGNGTGSPPNLASLPLNMYRWLAGASPMFLSDESRYFTPEGTQGFLTGHGGYEYGMPDSNMSPIMRILQSAMNGNTESTPTTAVTMPGEATQGINPATGGVNIEGKAAVEGPTQVAQQQQADQIAATTAEPDKASAQDLIKAGIAAQQNGQSSNQGTEGPAADKQNQDNTNPTAPVTASFSNSNSNRVAVGTPADRAEADRSARAAAISPNSPVTAALTRPNQPVNPDVASMIGNMVMQALMGAGGAFGSALPSTSGLPGFPSR